MIKRWTIYIKEMYPPIQWTILSLLVGFGVQTVFNVEYPQKTFPLWPITLFAAANVFLFFLYVRIGDEFKDLDTDRRFFPERPVPSGRITLRDLAVLNWLVIGIMFAINILWRTAFLEFIITFVVFYLASKWFFIPKILENNRILTFITHSPIYFFLMMLVIAFYSKTAGVPLITKNNLLIAVWFLMPFLILEIARKTRSPEEDKDGYQSYSQMLGFRKTVYILIVFISVHFAVLIATWNEWGISVITIALFVVITFLFLGICIRAIVNIPEKNTLMGKISRLYLMLSYILIIVNPYIK